MAEHATRPVLELSNRPDPLSAWWSQLVRHRNVLLVLARKDFHTRYKRASLGVAWAVAVPVLQAAVMAVVFSRVVRTGGGAGYGIYVMSGVIPFTYFASALTAAVASIVEGSSLTDKVWFPRLLLAVVPALSNLVGLAVTLVVLVIAMPILGVGYTSRLVLLVPAALLLVAFTCGLGSVLSALNVYFRDVRFLAQAALMVWMYATPIIYPVSLLHGLRPWVEANPLTGVVALFHMATVGSRGPWLLPLVVSILTTLVLLVVGAEAQRRHDRLFVDLL